MKIDNWNVHISNDSRSNNILYNLQINSSFETSSEQQLSKSLIKTIIGEKNPLSKSLIKTITGKPSRHSQKKKFASGMKRNRSDSKPGQSLGPDELRKVYVSLCGLMQIEPGPNFGVRYNYDDKNLCIVQYLK